MFAERWILTITNLLENLLEWSRVQRKITSYRPAEFKLGPKVAEVTNQLLAVSEQKSITIEALLAADYHVFADDYMVCTILRNLLTNAIKFTPTGGYIKISAETSDHNRLCIKVADNGIGMNQQLISNLFLLNDKANRNGTHGEPSTGLGLLICKEFAEMHGSTINVQSEEGKGSIFSFCLPTQEYSH